MNQAEDGIQIPSHQNSQQNNNYRRTSQRVTAGDSDHSNSPVSRTDTPAIHHSSNIAPQHMFDGVTLSNHDFQPSPSLLNLRQPSPGSTSSQNDRHLEPPQTYDGLIQANNSLKTRVNELEVINDLFRTEVSQLNMTRQALEQSQQREEQAQQEKNDLKRQVEELEHELDELREGSEPRAKRPRISEASEYPDPPQPFMS